MKGFKLLLLLCFCSTAMVAQNNYIGVWKTIDDEDGEVKSHIEIYEEDGMLRGKVVQILSKSGITECTKCKGERKDQPIMNMDILWDMKAKGKTYDDGKILDPAKGKIYDCKLSLEDPNTLEVRGYIKSPLFGRTQKWYRVAG